MEGYSGCRWTALVRDRSCSRESASTKNASGSRRGTALTPRSRLLNPRTLMPARSPQPLLGESCLLEGLRQEHAGGGPAAVD